MSSKLLAVSTLPLAVMAHANSSATIDETLVVTASKFEQPVSSVLAPISVLTRNDLEQMQAESLVEALKTLPGIEIGQSGGRGQSASIFLRGTESNHVLVLIDGVRLPRTMMGSVDFNMLPLNSIEQIEVVRGSGATVYGSDAIGGVINIITRSNVEQTRVGFGLGSFGSGSANAGTTQQLTDTLAMQISGGFESAKGYNVKPDSAPQGETHGFKGKNLALRFGYTPSEQVRANVVGRWYQNQIGYDSFGTKKNAWVESQAIGADISYQTGNFVHQAKIDLGEQDNYDYLAGANKQASDLTSSIQQTYLSLTSRFQVNQGTSLTAGVDGSWEKYLDGTFIDASIIADNPRQNVGVFGLAQWQLSDAWQLEASVRHDQNDQFGGNQTGLFALGWDLTDNHRFFASLGNAFKAPGFDALYGVGGNLDLAPEKSTNAEAGFEGTNFNIGWSVNAYFNQIDDMIVYTGDWPNGRNENIDKAEIRGIELAADFDLGDVYNQVSIDLKDPMDTSKNEVLARRAKHIYKWQTQYNLGDLSLGTQYQYQSERLDYSGGSMLPSYSVWDATAQYYLSANTTVSMKLANVFDKKYETAGGYPAPERSVFFNVDLVY